MLRRSLPIWAGCALRLGIDVGTADGDAGAFALARDRHYLVPFRPAHMGNIECRQGIVALDNVTVSRGRLAQSAARKQCREGAFQPFQIKPVHGFALS